MINSKLLNRLLTANIVYEKYSRNYRRLILLNILLYLAIAMSGLFAFFNFFKLDNVMIASFDMVMCLTLVYGVYDVHKNRRLKRAINIFIAILFVFLIAFSLLNQNQSFGIIWTIFFPLVSLLLLDKAKGLAAVALFYFIIFFFTFEGIGVWQEGNWDIASFLRFFMASLTLSAIVYFIEYSHELSEDMLEETRAKEEENMRTLQELSSKDALTKLYNRRYLHEIFPKEFQTAQRHEYYFGFFILDVDFFKQYNDTYGHQKGDEALKALASVLKTHMRRSEDFVFRLGGEEFCGICVSDDESKIEAQIKVLLHAIESLGIEHKSSSVSRFLTASIGVQIIKNYDNYGFDRLYKEADEALYRAKDEGRKCIIFAQDLNLL